MNLVTFKVAAKIELLFSKLTSKNFFIAEQKSTLEAYGSQ
jgi:hypothetical protein